MCIGAVGFVDYFAAFLIVDDLELQGVAEFCLVSNLNIGVRASSVCSVNGLFLLKDRIFHVIFNVPTPD